MLPKIHTSRYYNHYDEAATVVITDVLDSGFNFAGAAEKGVYETDAYSVIWKTENVPPQNKESVDLTVT